MSSFKPLIKIYHDSLRYLDILAASKSASQAALDVVSPSDSKAAIDAQVEPPAKGTKGPFLEEFMRTLSGFFQPSTGQFFFHCSSRVDSFSETFTRGVLIRPAYMVNLSCLLWLTRANSTNSTTSAR